MTGRLKASSGFTTLTQDDFSLLDTPGLSRAFVKETRQNLSFNSAKVTDEVLLKPTPLSQNAHLRELKRLLAQIKIHDIEAIIHKLLDIRAYSGTIYVVGNGGSAANASHCAAHLWEHKLKAICLTDNVPLLTAKANDVSYISALRCIAEDNKFSALIIFSCSGNSANVLMVAKHIHVYGLSVIGFLGNNGGKAKQYCSLSLVLDSKNAAAVEDAHSAAMHAVAAAL